MKTSLGLLLLALPFVSPPANEVAIPQDGPFATPTEGLAFPAAGDGVWSMMDLLDEYGRVTHQSFIILEEARPTLERTKIPLRGPLEVAPAQVHSVVENLLVNSGYVLSIARESSPRLLTVTSRYESGRGNLRSNARYVAPDQLTAWLEHPAHLIHTAVHLKHVDARVTTNSIRSMMTDSNVQQILAGGDSNSIVITGFTPWVADLVELLKDVDKNEGMRLEELANNPPPGAEPK